MDFNTIKGNFLEVLKGCFNFGAKWDRIKYWTFAIIITVLNTVISSVFGMVPLVGWLIAIIASIATVVVCIGPACGRLRDAGFSPLHLLWCLTAIGSIVPVIMCLLPSKNN